MTPEMRERTVALANNGSSWAIVALKLDRAETVLNDIRAIVASGLPPELKLASIEVLLKPAEGE